MAKYTEYRVRWAEKRDWAPAIKTIWAVYKDTEGKTTSEEGIKSFFDFISSDRLYAMFLQGEYPMLLVEYGKAIIGVGTIREKNRLSLLFVKPEFQKMGWGSILVDKLSKYVFESRQEAFYVKAAPAAVEFYKKNGFAVVEDESTVLGIPTVLMEKRLT